MTHGVSQRTKCAWLLAALTAGGGVAAVAAPPLPEDLLEYLGSWESDDGDWLVASAATTAWVPAAAPLPAQPATPVATTTPITGQRSASQAPAPSTERKP